MKLVFGVALVLAWATSFAQQAPRAMEKEMGWRDQVPREAQVPNGWKDKWVQQVPQAGQGGSTAQADLLRAQTEAIKALAARVDELSARVSKLEKGAR